MTGQLRGRRCANPRRSAWLGADPSGTFGLTGGDADAYRLEFDAVSSAVLGQTPPAFGRTDAVEQATVLEAVRRAARDGAAVRLPGRR